MSTTRTALKYGLFIGLGVWCYSLAVYFLELNDFELSWLKSVIWIGGMLIGLKEFRTQNNDLMSYKQGLGLGVLASTVGGFFEALFLFLNASILNPKLPEMYKAMMMKAYEKSNLSEQDLAAISEMVTFFSKPNMLFVGTVFGGFLFGLFFSLVLAAMMRSEKK
ncbi:MAG: DUF4199 domain-containing protein [Cytophagia bacterium]|nr:MAG: DUF4199 domain-containing protein [Cytophagales bacterium]TAG00488.1 MAG: DUF4199 domain-containing protein [Cytophagia bacterium]TAG37741.1 MAG: DUF4199 domain-containing protein [Cytophagia bacterium]TAH28221.1 MAG: DUF4199 domain-containing protein [Cytophagales bacterium]